MDSAASDKYGLARVVRLCPRYGNGIGVSRALGYNRQKPVPAGTLPMETNKLQPLSSSPESSAERLDSWKEIAAYLKRDERTVRRWEQEGLPVHRHVHKKQASIYAYKAEVDAWWNNGRQRLEPSALPVLPPAVLGAGSQAVRWNRVWF